MCNFYLLPPLRTFSNHTFTSRLCCVMSASIIMKFAAFCVNGEFTNLFTNITVEEEQFKLRAFIHNSC